MRCTGIWSRLLTFTLILAFVVQGTEFARAQAPQPDPGVVYRFSSQVPDAGKLDAFHTPSLAQDSVPSAIYALRTVAVEDLLNTRRALKILLGGTDRARTITRDSSLSFDAPQETVRLYPPGSDARNLIEWVNQKEPPFDFNLRARLVNGLVYVTALIARYEQDLKFLQTDWWKDEKLSLQFYLEDVRPLEIASTRRGRDFDFARQREFAKRLWMSDHHVDDQIAVLAGDREMLLDRYRILATPVRGKALYQHILDRMVAAGFPDPSTYVQTPLERALPGSEEGIELPTQYEDEVEAKLAGLSTPAGATWLARIGREIAPLVDESLLSSLNANTERLQALSREVDYRGKHSQDLFELGRYPELWKDARARYSYLGDQIDFDRAKTELDAQYRRIDSRHRKIRYTLYGAGVGLGIISFIATSGADGILLGIGGAGAKALFIGSGLLTSTASLLQYVDAKKASKVARDMFLGTVRSGSESEMTRATYMESRDFSILLTTVTLLGCDLPVTSLLARGRDLIRVGARTVVRLSEPEIESLRNAVTTVAARAEQVTPMGVSLLRTARALLGMARPVTRVMKLKDAIAVTARELGWTRAAVQAKLEANPMVGRLIRGWSDRVLADPGFLAMMVREQVVGGAIEFVSEYHARGDRFGSELGQVGTDLLSNALGTAALVWITAPRTAATAALSSAAKPQTIFDAGFGARARLGTFLDRSKTNLIVGFGVNAASSALMEGISYVQNRDDVYAPSLSEHAENVLKSALFAGSFMAISSNVRYQALGFLNRNMERILRNDTAAKMMITRLSIANNYFGSWHYVKLIKLTGAQKSSGQVVEPESSGLQARELGGAYVRVDQEDPAESYLLDFLR